MVALATVPQDKASLQRELRALKLPVTGDVATLRDRLRAARHGVAHPKPVDHDKVATFKPLTRTINALLDELLPIKSDDDIALIDAAISDVIAPLKADIKKAFRRNLSNWDVVAALSKNGKAEAYEDFHRYYDPVDEVHAQLKSAIGEHQNRKRLEAEQAHRERQEKIAAMTTKALEDEAALAFERGEDDEAQELIDAAVEKSNAEVRVQTAQEVKRALADSSATNTRFIPDLEKIRERVGSVVPFIHEDDLKLADEIGGIEIWAECKFKIVDRSKVKAEYQRSIVR